jgi:hypothetical protein
METTRAGFGKITIAQRRLWRLGHPISEGVQQPCSNPG